MEHNFFSPLGIIDNLLIGVSSIRQAVATEIAPKTPIERWPVSYTHLRAHETQ